MNNFKEFKRLLNNSKKVYLTSHVNPDGDSIGSLLGLTRGLKKLYGDSVFIMAIKDEVPKKLNFMDTEYIEVMDNYSKGDLLITLDCGDIDRIGIGNLSNIEAIVNIDHHITNTKFGNINFVDDNASSTAEIVYSILKELEVDIDTSIASSLYAGISSDTGSFKYSNTSYKTHKIVSELLEIGINAENINIELYQNNSIEELFVLQKAIENLEIIEEIKLGIVYLRKAELESINATNDDTESIVNVIRDIDSLEISCLLKEDSGYIKGSLRSKENFDVSKIANIFGGGGHKKASGFKVDKDIESVKKIIINEIKSRL